MKRCRECKQEKGLNKFNKKPRGKDGLNARCMNCICIYEQEYRNKNTDKEKSRHKKYRDENKEKIKSANKIYRKENRDKELLRQAKWRKSNPKKARAIDLRARLRTPKERRNRQLLYKFKISLVEYNELLSNQGGLCAICKRTETSFDKRANRFRDLCVDHDHITGKIRGLLCGACNKALGLLRDDTDTVENALRYLVENKTGGFHVSNPIQEK